MVKRVKSARAPLTSTLAAAFACADSCDTPTASPSVVWLALAAAETVRKAPIGAAAETTRLMGIAFYSRSPLRMLRSLDRRQRFDIVRDRGAIPGRELRRIADDRGHRATDRIAVRHVAGFKDTLDVPFRVITNSSGRNVGNPTVAAFLIRTAGEALADDGPEKIAGTVTLRAVAWTVDEISTAVPLR
jgi:hypothetical protein